jgi:molybdopterin-guanine dinucleotide biosynthesis protein A
MGRDKATIVLGGKTLLARAVETLRQVVSSIPGVPGERTQVTVIGQRTLLEGADRSIPDNYPGCGPVGGMEAALGDLEVSRAADWALFLPVDMPFLPAEFLAALVEEWMAAAKGGARVCHMVVDGRAQPLVSLIHREIHPFLVQALQAGEFRVTPVLQSACKTLASINAGAVLSSRSLVWQTAFTGEHLCPIDRVWSPDGVQWRSRHLWFANLNTERDLREAETFLYDQGSMSGGL